jgi:hypothetical protein
MIGIQREWVNEMLAKYKEQYPDDTREDRVIVDALCHIRKPAVYFTYLRKWQFEQVFKDSKGC